MGKSFPYQEEEYLSRGIKDRFDSLNRIVSACKKNRVDYLFLVGDIFEQDLFKRTYGIYFMEQMASLYPTKVLYVLGNHDFKLETYLRAKKPENMYIFSSESLDLWVDEAKGIEIYGQSWNNLSYKTSLNPNNIRENTHRKILLHHGMWQGEEYFPLNLDPNLQDTFTYIGLGHVHKPSKINSKTYMVGTPEPLTSKDVGERGYILGHIGQKLDLAFIPDSKRTILVFEIEVGELDSFEAILERVKGKIEDKEAIYHFQLKGVPLGKDQGEALAYFLEKEGICATISDESNKLESMAQLYTKHRDDIIGEFIRRVDDLDLSDNMKERIAKIGIEALILGGQND